MGVQGSLARLASLPGVSTANGVAERAAVRPGITGWAQVNGGHQLSAAEKMALDTWYVRNAGPWLDAWIVCLTLRTVLFGERVNHQEIERATTTA
jgi:lipopolysaccharide/colanic/teichoic acid biosynthesis glycosyltransferase